MDHSSCPHTAERKSCYHCQQSACLDCLEDCCCDCSVLLCKDCVDDDEVTCGCYGSCDGCGRDVNRGENGWPCSDCEKWLCMTCKYIKENPCRVCNPPGCIRCGETSPQATCTRCRVTGCEECCSYQCPTCSNTLCKGCIRLPCLTCGVQWKS